jgi:hypothetical protein
MSKSKKQIQVGTEVVCDGLRGIVKEVADGVALIEWEAYGNLRYSHRGGRVMRRKSRFERFPVAKIRRSGPIAIHGIATVRFARGANRLQHLLKDRSST